MTAIIPVDNVQPLIQLVLDGLTSENSRRAYGLALREYLEWHRSAGLPRMDKASVQAYKAKLQTDGLAPSSINVKLSAVRKLVPHH